LLITAQMFACGAAIIDLGAERAEIVDAMHLPARLPVDASQLDAGNVVNLVRSLYPAGGESARGYR
jgi:NAD/NADP transhydrogenase alpha subunit